MTIKLRRAAYHRNGSIGTPFCVSIFTDEKGRRYLGVTFDAPGHYAVFDIDLLNQEVIDFGLNSWRGQDFVDELPKPSTYN